jgi:hypothetical protein
VGHRVVAGSNPVTPIEDRKMVKIDPLEGEFKAETTVIICEHCENKTRVCGKNGTSIPYLHHCPVCGTEDVDVGWEMIDLLDSDCDYYGTYEE